MSKTGIKIEASTSGTHGQIRIVDFISMYGQSSSTTVREVVDDFISKGIAETEVYINSRGGSVTEAQEITNELARLPKVVIQFGALAASAGTYPATKFYTKAYENSQIMIHKPKIFIEGNEDQVEADLRAIKNVTDEYRKSYANKMKKTEDEVNALWDKGDYWMTAQQAKELGLVDEVIAVPVPITAEDVDRMVACGCPNPPKPEKPEIKSKMENRNQIIAALKLPADATDAQIEAAVKEAQAKAEQVDALTAAQAEARKQEAVNIVDKAILDKKITADLKEKYVRLAENDFESTKAVLEAMPSAAKASDHIAGGGDPNAAAGREKWTMEDWQDKDPKGLAKMAASEPEKFEKLNAAYFGD